MTMELIFDICKFFIALSFVFVLVRMIKGPRLLDRVMSLDAFSVCVIGVLILESVEWNSIYFIDLILVFSLINFIGTVSFCYYLYHKRSEAA